MATGQHTEEHKARQAGQTVVIGVLDDHTSLADCELHNEENAITVTLRRAASWFREQGCGPLAAVMSDNHKAYTSTSTTFTDLLAELDARQILTPDYAPRWNGKIERFFGTARRERSHSRIWPNSTARDRALASFCASTTDGDRTQPPAAEPPSPASSKSAGRTTSTSAEEPGGCQVDRRRP